MYDKLKLQPYITTEIDSDTFYDGYGIGFIIDKKQFVKDSVSITKPYILNYIMVMKKLKFR